MPVDDALNGRQSYSGAFELFSQVQPLKHTEEFVDILHVKARAIVPDEQLCLIFASVRTANLDFGPFSYPRELNRVGEQVHKDDFQHGTVSVTNRKRSDIPGNVPILCLLPEFRDDPSDKALHIHFRVVGLGASDPRKAQEVVDQVAHSL